MTAEQSRPRPEPTASGTLADMIEGLDALSHHIDGAAGRALSTYAERLRRHIAEGGQ